MNQKGLCFSSKHWTIIEVMGINFCCLHPPTTKCRQLTYQFSSKGAPKAWPWGATLASRQCCTRKILTDAAFAALWDIRINLDEVILFNMEILSQKHLMALESTLKQVAWVKWSGMESGDVIPLDLPMPALHINMPYAGPPNFSILCPIQHVPCSHALVGNGRVIKTRCPL